ncbi:MAG: bifunctional [glutamate--ammonia ligase]-adenylyl-L-tyrosine phosphorylase/[glutamate--ammonia-ligase] adenylyltransferase [Verrucomicrobia bacterium]|nr:bifunctional [glutamate--ammonia ligase]-adenylyl-L-tyrosine phosphorylase/[glutamate--ammonia-ligase] adenylyltransferase [Verrucomicrobiota bacterium]
MKTPPLSLPDVIERACRSAADIERARLNFQRLLDGVPDRDALVQRLDQSGWLLPVLAVGFGASQPIGDTLVRHPEYLEWLLTDVQFDEGRSKVALTQDASAAVEIALPGMKLNALRRFKQREMALIGLRDLAGRANLVQVVAEVSNLADVCLRQVLAIHWPELTAKYGEPSNRDFAIIALGKLGGRELNYSSDIDLMFLYGADGDTMRDGRRTMSNEQFFAKLAETIVASVSARTTEGDLFRVDMRLRPEGKAGALVRTVESCEDYYASRGETWERMMLIKARCCAGSAHLVEEFLETIHPFRFPRYISEEVLGEIALIKQRIEREIVGDARLTRHVKLGVGGIREIEFVAQTLQLLHAGRSPFLQTANTLEALQKLSEYGQLPHDEVSDLSAAYHFLRTVEHRLQMEAGLQTHTIPTDRTAVLRLARSLGFETVLEFEKKLSTHTRRVRQVYDRLLGAPRNEARARWRKMFGDEARQAEFVGALAVAGFHKPDAAAKILYQMARGPDHVHISARTGALFSRILPEILRVVNPRSIAEHQAEGGGTTVAGLAQPDEALKQLQRFAESYGSRAMLFEMLASNPKVLDLLLRLFDNSRFLADVVVRRPELFEEVTRPDIIRRYKSRADVLEELSGTRGRRKAEDWIRIYKRAELLRCGVRDVLGLSNLEKVHDEQSTLAEACVDFALAACLKEMKTPRLPFAIIGVGKFGGHELSYGGDLDVLFITQGGVKGTNAAVALAKRLIEFMGRQTDEGSVYALDARLRPDGDKGVLAQSLDVYAAYYEKRALLWERQALTKARFIAGDAALGRQFQRFVEKAIYSRALTDAEMAEIARMRTRVERERSDAKQMELNLKTGAGGIIEVEFIVQALQLRHGAAHPAVRRPHTLEALGELGKIGALTEEEVRHLREDYMVQRRIELVLRRLQNTSSSCLPASPEEQAAMACRLGAASLEEFWKIYRAARQRVRALYQKVFGVN